MRSGRLSRPGPVLGPWIAVLSLFLISLCLGACGAASEAALDGACDPEVKAALGRLLERPAEEWAFVIVEHAASQKYVQFAMEGDELFTDLPLVALSPDEQERARLLFAELGVRGPVTVEAPSPSGGVDEVSTFQKRFGRDTDEACRFVARALREVYLLPEGTQVSILEDGD